MGPLISDVIDEQAQGLLERSPQQRWMSTCGYHQRYRYPHLRGCCR